MAGFLAFLEHGVNLIGAFDLTIVLVFFLLFVLGEGTGVSVPYLVETTWLLAGYQLHHGQLDFPKLLLLLVAAQLGRQVGATGLYFAVRGGGNFAARHAGGLVKYVEAFRRKARMTSAAPSVPFMQNINLLSPIAVAAGMLLWMRIPLAVILSIKGQLKVFLQATSLSGIVYDGTYVGIGVVLGTTTKLTPVQMIPYFFVVLTAIGIVMFAIRRIANMLASRKKRDALKQPAHPG